LINGVELDPEEWQTLRGSFSLVRVDYKTELADDRLSESEVALHVRLRMTDEEEVVEIADVADSSSSESEVDDRQELCTHTRCRIEAERHVRELIQAAIEAKAKVSTDWGM
jgi:hypothetical protein